MLVQENRATSLRTGNYQYIFQPIAVATQQGGAEISENGVCPTITAAAGMSGNNQPWICKPVVYKADDGSTGDVSPTLVGDHNNRVTDHSALVVSPVYCLQGNGIERADTAGCNGKGWRENECYTLNTIDRPAVAYLASGKGTTGTLMASMATKQCLGDQEAFSGDYHIIEESPIALDRAFFNQGQNAAYPPQLFEDGTNPTLVARGPNAVCVRYIVRRLTPTECARLQGFPDCWGHPDKKDDFTDEEYSFWLNVRNTHAEINGKQTKDYTKAQMLTWYNKLHTDSSEYKMWGNGIALPTAQYVMEGIADVYS